MILLRFCSDMQAAQSVLLQQVEGLSRSLQEEREKKAKGHAIDQQQQQQQQQGKGGTGVLSQPHSPGTSPMFSGAAPSLMTNDRPRRSASARASPRTDMGWDKGGIVPSEVQSTAASQPWVSAFAVDSSTGGRSGRTLAQQPPLAAAIVLPTSGGLMGTILEWQSLEGKNSVGLTGMGSGGSSTESSKSPVAMAGEEGRGRLGPLPQRLASVVELDIPEAKEGSDPTGTDEVVLDGSGSGSGGNKVASDMQHLEGTEDIDPRRSHPPMLALASPVMPDFPRAPGERVLGIKGWSEDGLASVEGPLPSLRSVTSWRCASMMRCDSIHYRR